MLSVTERLIYCGLAVSSLVLGVLGSFASAQPISARIIDGQRTSEATFPYAARLMSEGESKCSGTLITPKHVLTAAHCFYGGGSQRAIGDTGYTVRLNGQEYRSIRVIIHPTYRPHGSEGCFEGESDVAIIELAQRVSGVSPVPLLSSPVPLGATVLLVGYGLEGTGLTGQSQQQPPLGQVNYGLTVVEGYGNDPRELNLDSLYFQWRFDSGESNHAAGDSGGPAFYDVGESRYLAGITCGGSGNAEFSTYSFNTRADLIKNWIDETTSRAFPFSISSASLTLGTVTNSDTLKISGTIFIGSAFAPRGRRISLRIGLNRKSFRLDSMGRSVVTRGGYFRLRGIQSSGRYIRSTVKFDAMVQRESLSEVTRLGFHLYGTVKGESHLLPIALQINNNDFSACPELVYTKRLKQWILVHP